MINSCSFESSSRSDYSLKDSDADEDGNLKDFVVSDSQEDCEDNKIQKPANRKRRQAFYAANERIKKARIESQEQFSFDEEYVPKSSGRANISSRILFPLCSDIRKSDGRYVIGRQDEALQILRMVQGDNGRLRPLLIGPAGIGKHSIINKVAFLLKTHLSSALWSFHDICCLNAGEMQQEAALFGASTSVADQFQKIVKDTCLKKEAQILYIRDIDALMNSDEESQNVQAVLRNHFPCIATLSGEQSHEDIVKVTARLQKYDFVPFYVKESPLSDVENIVKTYLKKNPPMLNINISDETICVAARLSARYIHSKPQPMKTIDLLQECANNVLINNIADKVNFNNIKIDPIDVAMLMEEKTKIAAEDLLNAFNFSQERFIAKLKEELIGQDYAIQVVSEAVASYKMGFKDPSKPWGAFLFVGPTGVGKTELAKLLVKHLYQDEDALIRIDGSEFTEAHTISRLIGAPPGYEGHDVGGQLTERLRKNPHCLVVVDEFEKIHPLVRMVFLHVLDAGRLTDGKGTTIDCRETVFVMTSNLGSQELFEFGDKQELDPTEVLEVVQPILISELTPELCNRFSAIVPFQPLKKKDIEGVIEVQLRRILQRLEKQADIELSWTKELVENFSKQDFDPKFGMRKFCRLIDDTVVEAIKNGLSGQKKQFKGKINMTVKDEEIVIRMKKNID